MEKVPMGPPRSRNPSTAADSTPAANPPPSTAHNSEADSRGVADGHPNPEDHESIPPSSEDQLQESTTAAAAQANSESQDGPPSLPSSPPHPLPSPSPSTSAAPYSIPPWSEPPQHPFFLEVLKDGAIVDKLHVSGKGAYMFGRAESCDFVLEHPSISRYHAVLQYAKGEVFIYDLGSTHGIFINKKQVKKKLYVNVHVGDVIRFGHSSRLYIFQGPSDLMPPELDLDLIRKKKLQEELKDREASLLRAKAEASLADGISWGMAEDAMEDTTENDADEITWQTFKGQLTERQEKTRGKIIKRMEKVTNMRKEIDAIRAKDIAQGGLTQGQQTQIARNEQRTQQIMEELDSLEETLNESIRESVGARVRKTTHAKKKGHDQDEDEDFLSDDDEFYDRTKRKTFLRQFNENQSGQRVETADTLLDKKYAIVKEMDEKKNSLQIEKVKAASVGMIQNVDALDAYMLDLSSGLATDTCTKMQEELSILQSELDRIQYLLKIADPTGEASRKKDATYFSSEPRDQNDLNTSESKRKASEEKKTASLKNAAKSKLPIQDKGTSSKQEDVPQKESKIPTDRPNDAPEEVPEKKVYTAIKPQWLGALRVEPIEDRTDKVAPEVQEADEFVDYKDRKKALATMSDEHGEEDSGSGLLIRKRKDREESEAAPRLGDGELATSSSEGGTRAEDAVALLLKHKRGYYGVDLLELQNEEALPSGDGDGSQKNSQAKRVLGPAKPDFLRQQDYESWVPPEGQSGDGRTSLNEKLGY